MSERCLALRGPFSWVEGGLLCVGARDVLTGQGGLCCVVTSLFVGEGVTGIQDRRTIKTVLK